MGAVRRRWRKATKRNRAGRRRPARRVGRRFVTVGLLSAALFAIAAGAVFGLPGQTTLPPGQATPPQPPSPQTPAGAPALGPAASLVREKSQTAFEGLSGAAALATAAMHFPAAVTAPARAGLSGAGSPHVLRYVGSSAAVIKMRDGKRAVAQSTLPLRAGSAGHLRPLSLALVRHPTFFSVASSLAPLRLPRRLGPSGIRLTKTAITVAPAPSGPSVGRVAHGRVFYPNVAADTDVFAAPLATGVDILYQLRSRRSPQRLTMRLTLPPGAQMHVVHVASRGGPRGRRPLPGPIAITRSGSPLAEILPPVAVDAQHRPVPLSYSVVGHRLVISVAHRGGRYAYPILVDPYIADDQRYWNAAAATQGGGDPTHPPDFNGWAYFGNPTGYIPGYEGTLPTETNSSYGATNFGNGINLYSYAGGAYTAGWYGEYFFEAPGTGPEAAHIFDAQFGNTANLPAGGYGTCTKEGIYNSSTFQPESGLEWRGPNVTDQYHSGVWASCSEDYTPPYFSWKVFCLSTCDSSGGNPALGSPVNFALFQMYVGTTGTFSTAGYAYMGSALVFESDAYAPHIDTSQIPSGWTTSSSFTVSATDNGVGMYSLSASDPGGPSWGGASAPSPGCVVAGNNTLNHGSQGGPPGSANTGDRNHRCNATSSISLTGMPEGSYNLSISSQDLVGNSSGATVPVKIDRTPPTLQPSGDLWDAANQTEDGDADPANFELDNTGWPLTVTATDGNANQPQSGVKSIDVYVDGAQPDPAMHHAQTCPAPQDNCSLTLNWTLQGAQYAPGDHTVQVVVTDNAGNSAQQTWTVTKYDPSGDPSSPPPNTVVYDHRSGDPAAFDTSTLVDQTASAARSGSTSPPRPAPAWYVGTSTVHTAYEAGKATGEHHNTGVVILDFGKPEGANVKEIGGPTISLAHAEAMAKAFGQGYYYGLPHANKSAGAAINLAIGVNNCSDASAAAGSGCGRGGNENITSAAGANLGAQILQLDHDFRSLGIWKYVSASGAIDAEPSYSSPGAAEAYVDGVASAFSNNDQRAMYNFGSADGCPLFHSHGTPRGSCSNGWSQATVAHVSFGAGRIGLPEIYYKDAHSEQQWQRILLYARHRSGGIVGGPISEYERTHSSSEFTPGEAFNALQGALNSSRTTSYSLVYLTDLQPDNFGANYNGAG